MTDTLFTAVVAAADFPEDGKFAADVNGWQVLIVRLDDGFHAVNDRCSHAASPLSAGRIRRGSIMCPLHGARFDIASGACIGGPYVPLRRFDVRVEDGQVEVAVPVEPPGMEDLPLRLGSSPG